MAGPLAQLESIAASSLNSLKCASGPYVCSDGAKNSWKRTTAEKNLTFFSPHEKHINCDNTGFVTQNSINCNRADFATAA